MPRTCKSAKLFAISETSIFQVFPLDSRREGLRERGWVIICRHFEKKATTCYVGILYLLSFMFPRYRLMEWGVPSLHHLKARPAFLLRLDCLPLPSVSLSFFLWQIFLSRCRMVPVLLSRCPWPWLTCPRSLEHLCSSFFGVCLSFRVLHPAFTLIGGWP